VHDSETVFGIDRLFSSLVVVGGGAVGCEYASIFTALGVRVTLVDAGERLLPFLDREISELLAESFRGMGMRLLLGSGRASVERDDRGLGVRLPSGEEIRPDKVLFASGRAGNAEGLGLSEAGVEVDERHRIVVDDTYRTTAEGIYAAGDVIGAPGLSSVSMEQGRVAACYALGIPFKETVDPMPPFGVYSIPEVAMVGLTEEAAASKGIDYEVGRGWFANNARATIAGATDGLVKLVFKRDDRKLLGVHVLGTWLPSSFIRVRPCSTTGGPSTTSSTPPSTSRPRAMRTSTPRTTGCSDFRPAAHEATPGRSANWVRCAQSAGYS
jgi:NAD(P) transhydrogenase